MLRVLDGCRIAGRDSKEECRQLNDIEAADTLWRALTMAMRKRFYWEMR